MLKIFTRPLKKSQLLASAGILAVVIMIGGWILPQVLSRQASNPAASAEADVQATSDETTPAATNSAAIQVSAQATSQASTLPDSSSPARAASLAKDTSSYQVSTKLAEVLPLNPDIVGWVKIPGTVIDYPIVCGDDNVLYLDHDYQGKKNKSGAIMMDFRNLGKVDGRHSILYGHNMKNGTMFHNLRYYKDKSFAKKNSLITVETLTGTSQWKVFSCYVSDTNFYFIQTDFANDKEYAGFLDKIQDKSKFDFGIDVQSDQQILTLVTCSYEFNDARFVVHAVRVD